MPPRPRTPRQPQDHKPKAKDLARSALAPAFSFEHEGQTYQLPPAAPYASRSTFNGGVLMDAILGEDQMAPLKMTLSVFQAAQDDILPDAWEAARAKPPEEFMRLVTDWMQASAGDPGK